MIARCLSVQSDGLKRTNIILQPLFNDLHFAAFYILSPLDKQIARVTVADFDVNAEGC